MRQNVCGKPSESAHLRIETTLYGSKKRALGFHAGAVGHNYRVRNAEIGFVHAFNDVADVSRRVLKRVGFVNGYHLYLRQTPGRGAFRLVVFV